MGVRATGLLEGVLEVTGRTQKASRTPRCEGAVRIGEEHDVGADGSAHSGESLGVGFGIWPDLDLETAVALGDELARQGLGRRVPRRAFGWQLWR